MKSLLLAMAALAICLPSVAAEPGAREVELNAQRDHADHLRGEARAQRARAEAIHSREDLDCMARILVNACRDTVRERYLTELKAARDKEIEANRLDTSAKSELLRLREVQRTHQSTPHEGGVKPAQGKPAKQPAAESSPVTSGEAKSPPPPSSSESLAVFEAQKEQRKHEAEQARSKEAEAAKLRAAKAREDAERYDARAKIVAERKAKRAAKASAPHQPAKAP